MDEALLDEAVGCVVFGTESCVPITTLAEAGDALLPLPLPSSHLEGPGAGAGAAAAAGGAARTGSSWMQAYCKPQVCLSIEGPSVIPGLFVHYV